jgi:16S rRNA (guanine966-N2)-methyltransferase
MKKPNHAGSGQIRIIGGQWRGRKLPVPESPGLRPTTDRVRETFLTGWRRPSLTRTASTALPAAARWGLRRCPAMRPAPRCWRWSAASLSSCKKLATLKADRGKVITTNTLSFLSQPGTPHEIVFVDPPFRQGLLEETLRLLETQAGWPMRPWCTSKAKSKTVYRRCRQTGICIVKKWPDRSPTVFTNVRPKERTMLINLGRLLMLCVWAFLLLNLFQPFPKPLNIFVNVALIFMILMHGLQLTLLKATQPKDARRWAALSKSAFLSSACLSSSPGRKN